MAISRVQGNARGTTTGSSIAVTMASTPISGNVLVAVIGTYRSGSVAIVNSITQTGVTWTKQISKAVGTTLNIEIWLGVVSSGASKNITITLNQAATYGAVADVCEYSGVATSNFLDKTATNSGSSKYPDTGTTATTTMANELWIGGTVPTEPQSSPTNGFTLLDGALYNTTMSVGYLEKIVSSTGTAHSSTTTADSVSWGGCIATFKGAGTAYSKTVSEILGLVDAKSTKTAFHKTSSEILGLVDGYDKNRCKKCKPSSVIVTF